MQIAFSHLRWLAWRIRLAQRDKHFLWDVKKRKHFFLLLYANEAIWGEAVDRENVIFVARNCFVEIADNLLHFKQHMQRFLVFASADHDHCDEHQHEDLFLRFFLVVLHQHEFAPGLELHLKELLTAMTSCAHNKWSALVSNKITAYDVDTRNSFLHNKSASDYFPCCW